MHPDDARFKTFPSEPGTPQLRWYIRQTAAGVLSIQEFLADFRRVHETVEQAGAPKYDSPEEARAIWDVLWAVEFCSPDITREESPDDWYIPEEVLAIVKRAALQLHTPA
jgi:hypothetical protein